MRVSRGSKISKQDWQDGEVVSERGEDFAADAEERKTQLPKISPVNTRRLCVVMTID